ncbi:hypothetical protein GALL_504070 [mine drainage metagenome]|uniref:Uncharacterized protein n=1 Tax=mine drainage metagenome TaxID=410659 RepID=A0A1J5PWL4_9ZZZZ
MCVYVNVIGIKGDMPGTHCEGRWIYAVRAVGCGLRVDDGHGYMGGGWKAALGACVCNAARHELSGLLKLYPRAPIIDWNRCGTNAVLATCGFAP